MALNRPDNPLVRAVARAPWRVRTKLLVAFVGIVCLLVVVGILGLRVLGQSNSRVERLGTLQLRAATYQRIQTQAQQLRQLLAIRVAGDPSVNTYLGGGSITSGGRRWVLVDKSIAAALSQLGPATNESRFGFVPPSDDAALLDRIRLDHRRFSGALEKIIGLDQAGSSGNEIKSFLTEAINADNDLGALTDRLATTTRAQTDGLIAQNRSAYTSSRNLFIGVGVASIMLALVFGFVLSWSLIVPIQRTEERLAEIASGDFSRHLDVPNRDELGALAANLNRMNDELGRLYEELENVSKHKSEFLANMSHDVLDAGRHLLSLINDILDLSKVEAGKMELDLADVSLPETLQSGLTMHGERATKGGITLGLNIEPDEIVIRADERKVRQVVFNLLSNAVKFTPSGGRIDVSAQLTDGLVEVAVTDTGSGIPPEDQEVIFEEFGQARGDGTGRPEGTGLGLPLSRKFIELHGGRLWVESVEGEGSTFRFTLPVKEG